MQQNIVDAYHSATLVQRKSIFDDERLTPLSSPNHSSMAAPGWVGSKWKPGGTVLMAINPGGGGDAYRVNPTDEQLYGLIRALRDATPADRPAALARLSAAWITMQATHNIRRVIDAVLSATNSDVQTAAFLNVLPFRTRNDRPARARELERAWSQSTGKQVEALQPRRIIALGCKAYDALRSAGAHDVYEVVLIKRAIGDSRIPPDAQEALAQLKAAA